jgi:hypothetical protein
MNCNHCGYASKNGDKAYGRCQNALNENYARPLWAVSTCTYDLHTKTQPKREPDIHGVSR